MFIPLILTTILSPYPVGTVILCARQTKKSSPGKLSLLESGQAGTIEKYKVWAGPDKMAV